MTRSLHEKIRRVTLVFLSFVIVFGSTSTALLTFNSTQVGATGLLNCTDPATLDMANWDWPSWMSTSNSSGPSGAGLSWFNANTSSYVIVGANYTLPGPAGQVTTAVLTPSSPQSKLVMYMSGGVEYVTTTDTSNVVAAGVTGRLSGVTYSFDRSIGFTQNAHSYNLETIGVALVAHGSTTDCVQNAVNVIYGTSWTDPQYNGSVAASGSNNSSPSGGGCGSLLNVTCYAANLFNGITTNIGAAFTNFMSGLYVLFVPDSATFQASWNSTYNALIAKLGFLTWPFTFMGNVFTAFITPTTTCCVIGAGGTFEGISFPGYDISSFATAVPTVWNFATLVIRGVTVFGLIYFLRSKFMEITGR